MSETMRALRVHTQGGPEGLIYEEAPLPYVGIGDVLLRVRAASFTPTELEWPSLWVDRAGRDRRPAIPSHEVSGIVARLGFGTTGLEVGDAVYGLTDWYRDGAAAEYMAVEARDLAPRPKALGHVEAAAVPLAGLTAWQALFDHGGLRAGQTVLIHGVGGGVGTYAAQLARAAGARVIGTGRGWARGLVRELGVERFVDVEQERLEAAAGEVDLVFDLVGGELLERSWSVLKPGGVVVSVTEDASRAAAAHGRGVRAIYFVVEPNRGQLIELGRRIDAGALRVVVGETRPLADGRAAFEAKQRGGVAGKTVLLVAPEEEREARAGG